MKEEESITHVDIMWNVVADLQIEWLNGDHSFRMQRRTGRCLLYEILQIETSFAQTKNAGISSLI